MNGAKDDILFDYNIGSNDEMSYSVLSNSKINENFAGFESN